MKRIFADKNNPANPENLVQNLGLDKKIFAIINLFFR